MNAKRTPANKTSLMFGSAMPINSRSHGINKNAESNKAIAPAMRNTQGFVAAKPMMAGRVRSRLARINRNTLIMSMTTIRLLLWIGSHAADAIQPQPDEAAQPYAVNP